jgi:hypothetical protein
MEARALEPEVDHTGREVRDLDLAFDSTREPRVALCWPGVTAEGDVDRVVAEDVAARALEVLDRDREGRARSPVLVEDRRVLDPEAGNRERHGGGAIGRRGRRALVLRPEAREVESLRGLDHPDRRSIETHAGQLEPLLQRGPDLDGDIGGIERQEVLLAESRIFRNPQPVHLDREPPRKRHFGLLERDFAPGRLARQTTELAAVLFEERVDIRDRQGDDTDDDEKEYEERDDGFAHGFLCCRRWQGLAPPGDRIAGVERTCSRRNFRTHPEQRVPPPTPSHRTRSSPSPMPRQPEKSHATSCILLRGGVSSILHDGRQAD